MTAEATVSSGREALERHAWEEAYQAFSGIDQEERLSAEELELLAEAAWWAGRPDEAVDALERAYAGYVQAEEGTSAAGVALRLAELAARRVAPSVFQGWLARAERLLEEEPESEVHAGLEVLYLIMALVFQNDPQTGLVHADRAIELGRRHGDRDAESWAMSFKAAALLRMGRVEEALGLIDEVTAAATSGELGPKTACDVYCNTISACRDLADYRRAGEWTERAERWMRRESISGYPGICRVHRAELKRLRGAWPEAEEEALRACEELERFRILYAVGYAYNEIGEVRLHMGDLEAAEEAFRKAYEHGWHPEPGMSLLLLARGEAEEAAASIARSLETSEDRAGSGENALIRGRLLPAQVEIALARDDLETARAAATELEEIAAEYESSVWEAAARMCRGAVRLHEGEAREAVGDLNRAWRLWQEVDFPYESAEARTLLGRARLATGDETGARLELEAARSAFQELGATPDVHVLERLLATETPGPERGPRTTKTFMFTDIVASTDLVGLIGDAAWESLLAWHDRELRAAFAHHGGEEVSHTGDGFFVAFDEAAPAIQCAVDIQRRLAEHRREHGFAPWVRIGLHIAEATRRGADYRGAGVHAAARVGALGDREEIVVSRATLEAAGDLPFPTSDPREVTLKGITQPVEVVGIDWR